MAVTFDAAALDVYGSLVTSVTTTLTIAANTHRVLIPTLAFSNDVSNVCVQWDYAGTQQLATLLKSVLSGVSGRTDVYALLEPATGTTLTLSARWTTSSGDTYLCASAWFGADQSGGSTSFPHTPTNTGVTTPTLTITSAVNNATVALGVCNTNFSVPTQTQIYLDNTGGSAASASSRAAGAASVVHAWTATGTWATVGVDIAAFAHPEITTQPTQMSVVAGQTATFTVVANGTGTLHYQWKLNGSNVGTDSSSYTTAATTNTDNLDTVQCVVTDDNGSVTSSLVYLFVAASSSEWLWKA